MFYLNNFIQNIKRHPLWGGMYLLATLVLLISAMNFTTLESVVFKSSRNLNSGPYFHALISGAENHKRISRKLLELPGVHRVEILGENEIQAQVSSVLSNLNLDMKIEDIDLNYAGLKVVLNRNLQLRSQELIRDYLVRLVGESKLTLGAIKAITKAEKLKNQLFSQFREWGVTVVSLGFIIIWALVGIVFSTLVRKSSYIIEHFQRRKKVGLKVMLTGSLLLFVSSLLITLLVGQLSLIGMLVGGVFILAISSLQVGKLQWQE
ncbi:hypothetical protein A9Q84_08475 [Halobacteriovorax marinus]|uniref:Cell division protein FtsX n=1 Tax=Halobacteriovorax marinus TaxID=97084 RepID=A0A1Y5F662_9BACT|nr:hypothetical protein A9Q84_08475 [Halobacteriovorax marinus]